MKKLLSFIVMTLMGMSLMAKPVDPTMAVRVAQNFAATQVKMTDNTAKIVYTHPMPNSGQPAMYVVNVGPSAFVIVAADDIAHPVLGYSMARPWPVLNGERRSENGEPNATEGSERAFLENGEPNATEGSERASLENGERAAAVQLPSQVSGFLDDLASQIQAAQQQNITQDCETATEWQRLLSSEYNLHNSQLDLPDSVGPLLTTTWDQGQYYNALCPEDTDGPDGHAVTGCVATAMAQIINYWGYPIHGRGTHSYNHNTYGTLSVNYDSATYDYANMPNALTSTSTPAQVNAVATLMRDCGVAANMGYGSSESSTYDVDARAGLINFFRISPNASYAEKAYFANDEWNDMLRTDLGNSRVVMYSGHGTGGHTFVCDGYNANNYYHFNFGWSGYSDGWYTTSAVNPGGMDFNSNQSAILGIVPDSTGNVILGQMTGTSTFIVDEPLEFYHLLGHNAYEGTNYGNTCDSYVFFVSANNSNQLVADIIEFEDQNITINDGQGTWLKDLHGGSENDLSPVVSLNNALNIVYSGLWYYAGFKLNISQDEGCRMVSNIVASVDTTTVHLMWIENGSATQWQIEYGEKGFAQGSGTLMLVTTAAADITFPQRLTEYDVYIRSVCGGNNPWSKKTITTGAPYWQDVVNSQPESFVIDWTNGSVMITCAEDLVWYFKNYNNHKAIFVNDVDLGGYKWKPISFFSSLIQGNGHSIANLYIEEVSTYSGFISFCSGEINDLGFESAYVSCRQYTGVICGQVTSSGRITNCYVDNTFVNGTDFVGGLTANNQEGVIKNCYVNVQVVGNRWSGIMTGDNSGTIINCYAAGSIQLRSYCYNAGISAYARSGTIKNCYSVNGLPMGVVGFKGVCDISDTSSFFRDSDQWTLNVPISFENSTESLLIGALNKGVEQMNDSTLRVWISDTTNNNLPKLGDLFDVQCSNVTNVDVNIIKQGDSIGVVIGWGESGQSNEWEIKYQPKGSPNDSAIIITAVSNPDTLFGIPLARVYTFSVRSVCDSGNHSGWVSITEMIDLPYWTDIVAEQPNGFDEDADGNVSISSPEGLAWLAVLVNGFHGQEAKTFVGKTVTLVSDINLCGYRWYPIGRGYYLNIDAPTSFNGVFDGNDHTISGLYINEKGHCLGLFGYAFDGASFYDVTLTDGLVNCYDNISDGGGYGGLLGSGSDIMKITGCYSDIVVKGVMQVGSLVGSCYDYEGDCTVISNCHASGDVYGRESTAGLIGEARGIIVQNCYATGNVYLMDGAWNSWYRGGLIGNHMSNAVVRNCYSTGIVEIDDISSWYGTVVGCPYMNSRTQYVYGLISDDMYITGPTSDAVSDTSSFYNSDSRQMLVTPVTIDGNTYVTLLDALNAWVAKHNEPMLKLWTVDSSNTNGGYPVFGDNFEPSCYNPTNVAVSQATVVGDTTVRTMISWEQEGTASSWEVMYAAPSQNIDSGTIIAVDRNPCVLTNLPNGHLLDFYVRAVCDTDNVSGWSQPARYIPDKLRWTEVVTSQPDGYYVDYENNVYISSAEGLAWLSSVMNKLNGNTEDFNPNKIILTADIDLSDYRWTSIANYNNGNSVFDGNGHIIKGLYCNENENYQGLFGSCVGIIQNVIFENSSIHGLLYNGTIAGSSFGEIRNCIVNGEVIGVQYNGGFCGEKYGNVTNSAFVGIVDTRFDILLPDSYNGYLGGLLASGVGSVENSYVAGEITESPFSGIITSTGTPFEYVSNCYYKSYTTSLPITYDGTNVSNVSAFSGNDTIWTLNTSPYVNGAFRTDLVDALNAWVDENNTDGQYFHWRTDTANINGGYPVFEVPPCLYVPRTFIEPSITACDSYTFNGVTYTESVSINDTLQTVNGCDSIVSQLILINHPVQAFENVKVCEGQSYTFNGRTLTETNSYYDTIFNGAANGCDSIVSLWLEVQNPTSWRNARVCEGQSYAFNGRSLTETNWYYDTIINGATNGCDSIVYLWLEVQNPTSWHNARVCEGQSYTFNGRTLTETNSYYDTIFNGAANGCDSIVYLWLEVQNNYSYQSAEICQGDSYSFAGQMLTESGTYFDTLTGVSANGCDSIVQLNFTVHPTYYLYDTVYLPANSLPYLYTYQDWPQVFDNFSITMNSNTQIVDTRVNSSGTIYDDGGSNGNYSDIFDGTIVLMANEGETIKLSGNYQLEGCCDYVAVYDGYGTSGNCLLYTCGDGSVDVQTSTGYLTIRFTSDGSANFDGFALQWNTQRAIDTLLTAAGDYTFEARTSYGCDNTFNLHLEQRTAYSRTDSMTVCSNNLPYAYADTLIADAGTYTFTYLDQYGIDSIVTLHLTINDITTGDTTAVACDSFTWRNTNYTNSTNEATHTLTNAAGCDSTVTLHLTVNQSTTGDTTAVACDSFIWWNTNYTYSTNEATHTLTNAAGCDSTVTLHLTINNPVHTATTEVACETYTWNGTAYTVSGNYTYSHADNNGCTQVDTLHLTINNPVHAATTEVACESYTWNGTAYAVSGDYTYSHLDNNGCTQVDTLHLTINNPVHTATTQTACETYTWNGSAYTASGNYNYTHLDNNGCTQVDTLHLTINNPVHAATTETACETYLWNGELKTESGEYTYSHLDNNGCTQVDTLHLTINYNTTGDTTATACDSFIWHGTTFTESTQNSTFTIPNSKGCDSTITLHLTINHSVILYDTLSVGSNELPYDYHGNTIDGEGDYTFTGTTVEGCDSTMYLNVVVNQVGIYDIQNSEFEIQLYPNPTGGLLTIEGKGVERVEVLDVLGRVVADQLNESINGTMVMDFSSLPQGAYTLRAISKFGTAVRRIIKN